ncbi:MAG: hypothetical protein KJ906_00215 [Nanoarchaeota archaeon]|nr:hypothetical protein [Nanoarchaeota archaeon]
MTKKMKGMELPINLLVVVAVSVIVLLGVVALFLAGFNQDAFTSASGDAKSAACSQLVGGGCTKSTNQIMITNFDADKDAVEETATTSGTNGLDPGTGWQTATIWTKSNLDDAVDNDNLAALCYNYYNINTEANCAALCGC